MYTPDFELIEHALQQKQNLQRQKVAMIQSSYDNIIEIIIAAKTRNNGLTDAQKEYVKWVSSEINKISAYDFSVDANYVNVMDWLKSIKAKVLIW
jgi:hypothetical protein